MKIGIIGAGNVGSTLGPAIAAAGHDVVVSGSRDGARRARVTTAMSETRVVSVSEAVSFAEAVLLAVPYDAVSAVLTSDVKERLTGKVLIDVTNPVTPDYMQLTVGFATSAAEEIARVLPGVRVVKAFNTLFAQTLNGAPVAGSALTVFAASDDSTAMKVALDLATSLGYDAVAAGPLKNSRYLEPLAELLIQLGYGTGLGTEIGFRLLRGGAS